MESGLPITELNPNDERLSANERTEVIKHLLAELAEQVADHGELRIVTRIKGLEPELYMGPASSNPNLHPFAIITGEQIVLIPDQSYTYDVFYRRAQGAELFAIPYEAIDHVAIAKPYEY